MRIQRYFGLSTIFLIAVLLAACQSSEPQAEATPAPAATAAPVAAGVATPTAIPSGPIVIPTPSPGKAVVHGIIQHVDTKRPLSEIDGVDLFLAQVIYSTDGSSRMSSLDKTTAPRTDPNLKGEFVFADVEPGEYAVIARSPLSEVVAHRASDVEQDLVITIAAGETLDLGEVITTYP